MSGWDVFWRMRSRCPGRLWQRDCTRPVALVNIGGAFDTAEVYWRESLRIARQHRSTNQMARALFGLRGIAAHRGDYVLARDQFREGLALERDEASLPDVAEALAAVARIESILGEPLPSREHFEQARVIQRRLDDPWESAFVLHALAEQARDEQDLERAQALEDEAFAQWTRSGSRMGQRSALMNLAVLAFDRGDLGRACELAQRALELCQEIADAWPTTVRCAEIASEILQACGAATVVARLEAAASTRRQVLGAPMPPNEQAEGERTLEAAVAALPPDVYKTAWREGTLLAIHNAVELAADTLASPGEASLA